MAQPRSLTYRGNNGRSYPEGNESDGSRSPREEKKARKRNSVACARCRKRKIKCTGDLHDGNGCEACQAAGAPRNGCLYLRVNSHNIEDVAFSSDSDWPCTTPALSNFTNRSMTEPSQYAFANPYAAPGAPYSTAQTRPPNTSYSTSYNGAYDMQRPLQGSTPSYAEYSQQWHALPSNRRPTTNGVLYDQDPSRFETSTVPYMPSTGASVPNMAAEGSSNFPGLSPLGTHLPTHGGNRTLPYPVSIQSPFDSSNGSLPGGDGNSCLYQQQFETATSQRSVSSASQETIGATGQCNSTASSSPSETHENSTFGYTPITHRSPTGSGENTLSFQSVGVSTTSNIGSYTANSTSSRRSRQQTINDLPSPNPTLDGYGGHRGTQAPPRALESGMSVRNGNVYDPHGHPRILQPQPQRSTSYDLLNGSFEGSGKHSAKVLKSSGHGRRSDGKR